MKRLFIIGLLSVAVFAADITVKLKVNGMTCPSCVKNVKSAAMSVDGVKGAKVYLKDGKAEVVCDDKVKPQDIADAIKKEGYETQVVK